MKSLCSTTTVVNDRLPDKKNITMKKQDTNDKGKVCQTQLFIGNL